jgi:hypothetical protein
MEDLKMNKQAIITKLPDWADDPMNWTTAMEIMEREINWHIQSYGRPDTDGIANRINHLKEAWRIVSRGFAD